MKTCRDCGEIKTIDLFVNTANWCKLCKAAYNKKYHKNYRAANKESLADYHKNYYVVNRKAVAEQKKQYRAANRAKIMLRSARHRAINKELEFNITESYIQELLDSTMFNNSSCTFSGCMSLEGDKWSSPSVDRIDSSEGYVVGNIQIISTLSNLRKGNYTHDQLLEAYSVLKSGNKPEIKMHGTESEMLLWLHAYKTYTET